jgi:hypothetical protein
MVKLEEACIINRLGENVSKLQLCLNILDLDVA